MKITLHEVAAHAEVSIATVSRALNGLPVSKASLARVNRAVADLGYVANEAARALRGDHTMTMGLLFFDLRNTAGIDALSEAIEAGGYSLIISTARGDAERYDMLLRRFLERRVDAMFCIRPRGRGETLASFRAANIPVMAMFGGTGPFSGLPTMTPSFSEATKALGQHLQGLGHRRVALLRHETHTGVQSAIADSLKAQGFSTTIVEPRDAEGMSDVVASLLTKKTRSTAIVARDPHARGLIAACAALGVRVPRELSIVSICDDDTEPYHRKHGISSVTVDSDRIGRASGAAMLAWLAGSPPASKIHVQAAAFVPRGTTAAAGKPGVTRP